MEGGRHRGETKVAFDRIARPRADCRDAIRIGKQLLYKPTQIPRGF
jgi:hypothetical protein